MSSSSEENPGSTVGRPYLRPVDGIDTLASDAQAMLTEKPTAAPQPSREAANGEAGDDALWQAIAPYFPDDLENLEISFDSEARILWYFMRPVERPSFTVGLLRDIRRLQQRVVTLFEAPGMMEDPPIRYLGLASAIAGIFNFGGDLPLIARLVRDKDRVSLEEYARACIDVLHVNSNALKLPIATVSLVEGHALGGGFEAALSGTVIIADENAKFGLPEVLFNLFPGMGAYSLLARRVGSAEAERMITSGKVFSARELHQMGVVDIVAQKGRAMEAMQEFAAQQKRRFNSHRAIYGARHRFHNLEYQELWDITSIWVDAAMRLDDADLRRVDRLAASQDRISTQSIKRA